MGEYAPRVFQAEVAIADWEERPWIAVRALTDREALERESIGVRETYEEDDWGEGALRVARTYDLAAMAEYDLAHCLTDFCLPARDEAGLVTALRATKLSATKRAETLHRLPLAMGQWIRECIDRVNLRRPEDAATLAIAKKS